MTINHKKAGLSSLFSPTRAKKVAKVLNCYRKVGDEGGDVRDKVTCLKGPEATAAIEGTDEQDGGRHQWQR